MMERFLKAAIAGAMLLHVAAAPMAPWSRPEATPVYQANPRDRVRSESFDLKNIGLVGLITVSRPVVPIQTLVPGDDGPGEWTATEQPATIGSGPFSTQKPMMRFTDVPYRTIDGDYYVSVSAFHINGMRDVTYSVNNGPSKTVTTSAANPHTRNATTRGRANGLGVVSYAIRISAADFNDDGLVEIRAIGNPVAGVPRVMSFFCSVNDGGTLDQIFLYVDAVNGSDITGDGTLGNPFQTATFLVLTLASNSLDGNRYTIYCQSGSYQHGYTAFDGDDLANVNGWLTIMPAPGVNPATVIFNSKGCTDGWKNAAVRFKNVSISGGSGTLMLGLGNSKLWFDDCIATGSGISDDHYVTEQFYDPTNSPGSGFSAVYVTDCTFSNVRNCYWSCELVRNSTCDDIGTICFKDCYAVLHCSASNVVQRNVDDHQDVWANFAGRSNVVVHDLVATNNVHAQGLFGPYAGGTGQPQVDVAIVDFTIHCVPGEGSAPMNIERACTNFYLKNGDLSGGLSLWSNLYEVWTATDVVVENTTFSGGGPDAYAGVTIR